MPVWLYLQLLHQLHLQRHEHVEQLRDVITAFYQLLLDIGQFTLFSDGIQILQTKTLCFGIQ